MKRRNQAGFPALSTSYPEEDTRTGCHRRAGGSGNCAGLLRPCSENESVVAQVNRSSGATWSKWSRYNTFVPRQDGGAYLFNGRTGALVGLAAYRRAQIENDELLDDDFYALLSQQGFIVKNNVDEVSLVLGAHEKARGSRDSFSATIELTEACNFRCLYCYQDHPGKHLGNEAQRRILLYLARKMREVPHVHVNWFGGEPLLRFNTLRTLSERLTREAAGADCRLTQFLTSNGYLLTPDLATELARLGIGNVQITLDGSRATHDRLRPLASGRSTYDRVLEACVNVVRVGIELMVRVNVNRVNAETVGSLLDDLLEAGVTPKCAVIHAVRTIDHGTCAAGMADACFTNAQFARVWIDILREVAQRGFGLPSLAPIACNCPFDLQQTVMIGRDGSIRHCSSSDGLLARLDGDGTESEHTPLFDRIKSRRPDDDPACRACSYLPMCMGGCAYLREIGQEPCNPERYVLGELVALSAPITGFLQTHQT
ncbi:MAG: radical SAM protein [Acidobacteria bacterium]|nr:MAG: radical SAM protein [Acidobacteriota bacterium]